MKGVPAWRALLDGRTEDGDEASLSPPDPFLEPDEFASWQRFMLADCMQLAIAVASHRRLPLGRLMSADTLAHAFVILTDGERTPDRWLCLDWSGLRTLRRMRDDMRPSWGRLVFDWSGLDARRSPMKLRTRREVLRLARSRPHIAQALSVEWPRTATRPHRDRLRYLDVLDVQSHRGDASSRIPDIIDINTIGKPS